MNNTEHFNLLTYGPDDIVNVMTVDKSNMETIDAALQKNLIQGISKATELKTDTVHALTRFDEDCPIFRFTSTTNFVAGETFVVDGQQVTALTPAGSSLATGAYVIGSEVLCILRDTRLTIFVSGASTADDALKLGGELPEFYAKQEDMDSVTATANAAGSLAQSNLAKINNMNGRLTQCDFGTEVDLENTSETKLFKFPNDGYIRLYSSGNSSAFVRIFGSSDSSDSSDYAQINVNSTANTNEMNSIYVRKGMKCYYQRVTGTGNAKFIPLI